MCSRADSEHTEETDSFLQHNSFNDANICGVLIEIKVALNASNITSQFKL